MKQALQSNAINVVLDGLVDRISLRVVKELTDLLESKFKELAEIPAPIPPAKIDPALRIVRVKEVIRMTGLSQTTLWRWERSGKFPRRRILAGSTVGWSNEEVEHWIRSVGKTPSST